MQEYTDLIESFRFLSNVIHGRCRVHSGKAESQHIDYPKFSEHGGPLGSFIVEYKPNPEEFLILLLVLAPHFQPAFLDTIIHEYLPTGGDFPAFGGIRGQNHRGILPTGETAQFIIAGNDLAKRLEVQQLFAPQHWFAQKGILWLEPVHEGEPPMSGRIILDAEWAEKLTIGTVSAPRFGARFPAARLETELDWSDLVLPATTLRQIQEIRHWVTHADQLLHEWGLGKRVKPGYRALFYGPPGTGKTLTATLLGKYTGKEVYRIDLSLVVSKFIGETEKNLSALFDKARNKNWILFFDEADALFGKRTDVRDAHDKYANQEVSYLLQKIEDFAGLSILASNFKSNIDEAFVRRFQSIVFFPMPKADERLLLWQKTLPEAVTLAPDVDLNHIARQYELSGSHITNIVQYCCLQLLAAGETVLSSAQLLAGIQRELVKENKVV